MLCANIRSSLHRCSIKIAVNKNFALFTGNPVLGSLDSMLETDTGVFCKYCKIFINSYFYRRLLAAASDISEEYMLK